MSGSTPRGRLEILKEMHQLSDQMVTQKDDADFLVDAVNRRQEMMEEYDRLQKAGAFPAPAPGEPEELNKLAQEILRMDAISSAALENHKRQAKEQLSSTNTQQKVLGYVNQTLSSSGSYMDYKK